MWGLGCVTYVLLCGCHPYDPTCELNDPQLCRAIVKGKMDETNAVWTDHLSGRQWEAEPIHVVCD